jgi:hypothetical protein
MAAAGDFASVSTVLRWTKMVRDKGGGVSAYPEIAEDFRLWFDPAERLAILRLHHS